MNYQEILDEIAGVFADEFDAPVSDVLTASVDDNGVVYGNLISAGNFYEYAADGEQLALDYLPEETREINDFAAGAIASRGVILNDSIDSPYDYAYGFLRLDAQVRCKKGGKPCGKICLPKGATCRKYGSSGSGASMKKVSRSLKMPGSKALAIGGLATAALAAGAGGIALANRGGSSDKDGVKKAKDRVALPLGYQTKKQKKKNPLSETEREQFEAETYLGAEKAAEGLQNRRKAKPFRKIKDKLRMFREGKKNVGASVPTGTPGELNLGSKKTPKPEKTPKKK